ncbi:MAG: molybdopterin converting factor subunit 1 [Alphaproteobacteria bacterium]|nr:MAG: molybdopterin converting factor subunit 1 [Alphaproteobacteria bacterium]
MQLLYFAWVRERLGKDAETVTKPADVATAGDLVDWLRRRGAPYDGVLAERARLRVAVNQEHAAWDAPVHEKDEVAIFPPVTGG